MSSCHDDQHHITNRVVVHRADHNRDDQGDGQTASNDDASPIRDRVAEISGQGRADKCHCIDWDSHILSLGRAGVTKAANQCWIGV